jgi:hypothetical protein
LKFEKATSPPSFCLYRPLILHSTRFALTRSLRRVPSRSSTATATGTSPSRNSRVSSRKYTFTAGTFLLFLLIFTGKYKKIIRSLQHSLKDTKNLEKSLEEVVTCIFVIIGFIGLLAVFGVNVSSWILSFSVIFFSLGYVLLLSLPASLLPLPLFCP